MHVVLHCTQNISRWINGSILVLKSLHAMKVHSSLLFLMEELHEGLMQQEVYVIIHCRNRA